MKRHAASRLLISLAHFMKTKKCVHALTLYTYIRHLRMNQVRSEEEEKEREGNSKARSQETDGKKQPYITKLIQETKTRPSWHLQNSGWGRNA